jgi:lipopolysaccharide/colanic/teichoic acid biosynthesis glycosyltransferase
MTAEPTGSAAPGASGSIALGPSLSGPGGAVAAATEVGAARTSWLGETAIRLLDVVGAGVGLLVLSPLLLALALAIKRDSPGRVLFRQRRLGKDLEPFSVAKFRTMREGADSGVHRSHVERMIVEDRRGKLPMSKLREDARVTRVGSFLRRTSLDELPQLWNVLRGEMSLVGPRPPIQYEVDRYPAEAFRRFAVRPGITGLWQVRGRSTLSFKQMIELDTEYVETRSLGLNLKILLLTLPTVIHGKGAA